MSEIERTDDEILDDFFAHPGFGLLQTELKAEIYQAQSDLLERAANWDQVVFVKGRCAAFAEIVNMKDTRDTMRSHGLMEVADGDQAIRAPLS